jgi:hypothetical protein
MSDRIEVDLWNTVGSLTDKDGNSHDSSGTEPRPGGHLLQWHMNRTVPPEFRR